jgi:transcriptional regulator with XRE-family HTH domain
MGFAENLRYLRRKYNVTQVLLAEEIHVAPTQVKEWEQTDTAPPEPLVAAIAAYFQIEPAWLMQQHELDEGAPLQNNPLDWKPRDHRRKVECLRCSRKFASEGPHNRICARCKRLLPPTGGVGERYRLLRFKA